MYGFELFNGEGDMTLFALEAMRLMYKDNLGPHINDN